MRLLDAGVEDPSTTTEGCGNVMSGELLIKNSRDGKTTLNKLSLSYTKQTSLVLCFLEKSGMKKGKTRNE